MTTQRALVGAFGLCFVLVLWSLVGTALKESSSSRDDASLPREARALLLPVVGPTTSSSSSTTRSAAEGEPVAPVETAVAPERAPEPVVVAPVAPPAPPKPPAPPAPARPNGSSLLYTGALLRRPVLPGAIAAGASPDKKTAELERAQDVADKRGTIVGAIQRVNAKEIAGWAYAWDDPANPIAVDVFLDGALVGTVASDGPRPDFSGSRDPSNPVGGRAWTCPAPAALADGDKHVVEALGYKPGSDAKRALAGSPWAYGGVQFPAGAVVWASERIVYGWANDPSQPAAPVAVTLTADGAALGKVSTQGQGHNADVFAQALAAAPLKKVTVVVAATGLADPNLDAAIQAKAQETGRTNHYRDLKPLAQALADTSLAYDELDFFGNDPQGNAIPLTGRELAGIKFSRLDESQPAFVFVAGQPITAGYVQTEGSSADGSLQRELSGSPYQLNANANRLPRGGVTFVNDVQVSGWAVDDDVLPAPVQVDVFVDGVYVQRIPADKKFEVLPQFANCGDPNHAFCFAPPEQYKDGKTHSIQFFAVNQPTGANPELPGSPTTFVGKRNASPFGYFDALSTDQASGWAYDPDAGAAPTQVEIWVDNVLWKTIAANVVRNDLVPIVTAEPEHGWTVAMPDSLKDGKHHTVRAFGVNYPDGPKQELAQSPKEINAQSPFFGIYPVDSPNGLTINGVIPGTAANQAGMLAGDVVHGFDGNEQTVDVAAFIAWAKTKEVGEQVVFRLWHDPSAGTLTGNGTLPPGSAPLQPGERVVVVTVGSR